VEESLSGVKGEIAVKIHGPDLEILEDKAEQVVAVLNGIRGFDRCGRHQGRRAGRARR
jgi:cobalt-zinc-cadmium resistance protein CzcA